MPACNRPPPITKGLPAFRARWSGHADVFRRMAPLYGASFSYMQTGKIGNILIWFGWVGGRREPRRIGFHIGIGRSQDADIVEFTAGQLECDR